MSSIEQHGLYFDTNNQLRVLDPEASATTSRLIDECGQFVNDSNNFQKIVDDFSAIIEKLAAQVEQAKIKALGTRNELKSIAKEQLNQRQQLEALISERRLESERLRVQLQSLQRQEAIQQDFMDQLTNSK